MLKSVCYLVAELYYSAPKLLIVGFILLLKLHVYNNQAFLLMIYNSMYIPHIFDTNFPNNYAFHQMNKHQSSISTCFSFNSSANSINTMSVPSVILMLQANEA